MLPILSIETSDDLCSVAILKDEVNNTELNAEGKHIHSEKLLPMIEQILDQEKLTIKEIGSIAVSEGPGSFTGLRIGMAAAKGLATGSNIPIIPVPSFSAYALKIFEKVEEDQNFIIVKKASRDEVYFAKYANENHNLIVVNPLSLIDKMNLNEYQNDDDLLFSNLDSSISEILSALDIAKWAYKFGKDLLTSDYNFIEPKYFKEFIVRN